MKEKRKERQMTGRTIRFTPEMLDYLIAEAEDYETDLSGIVRQHIRKARSVVFTDRHLFVRKGERKKLGRQDAPPHESNQ